jgi:hypothetical protein
VNPLQRLNRDAVTAIIVTEMLTQGVVFDTRTILRLPVPKGMIYRALKGLKRAGVVTRSEARTKYLLSDNFLEGIRQEITKDMPRGMFIHYPDLSVFDVCGIEDWSAQELETYVAKIRQRWVLRKGFA